MYLRIDNDKLLEEYRTIWTKIEDLRNIQFNALPVDDDRYIKTKIGTYGDKVYTNFLDLNVSENKVVCNSFTVISIDSLLVYDNSYYLQVYLDNCAYKTVGNQMIDYLDYDLFETDEDYFLLILINGIYEYWFKRRNWSC